MAFLFNIIEGKVSFYVILWILIILSATICDLSLGTMCLLGTRKLAGLHAASARTKIFRPVSSLARMKLQYSVMSSNLYRSVQNCEWRVFSDGILYQEVYNTVQRCSVAVVETVLLSGLVFTNILILRIFLSYLKRS